jgi:hypothetical protein
MKRIHLLLFFLFLLLGCTKENEPNLDDNIATWGYMQFYQATDLGLGPLSVYVNGTLEGQVSGVDADGPGSTDCTITGFSKKFEKGSYSYRIQNSSATKIWQGTIDVPNYGMCVAIKLVNSGGGTGSGSTNGNVMFWTKNSTIGTITVNFNGQTNQITKYQSSGSPSGCQVLGFANYNLPTGTYSYTASSVSGIQWSGSVNVPTNNGCFLQELTYSGASGGGGGGSTTGNLVVWQKKDNGGGTATITVNGQKGYITNVYPNATQSNPPPCGATGCATFYNLAAGNYTVYYSDALGNSSGQAGVVAGACNSFGFN